jgi:outer membrane translocation and assembly module TamA
VIATLTYIPKPWEKDEYETSHHLCFNYGILRNAFNFGYIGRWGRLFGKWDFVIKARMDAPAVENFFGVGNESQFINKTTNYYQTKSERQYVAIGVERDIEKVHHFELSLIGQSVKVHPTGDHFINSVQSLIDPSVFDRKFFAGVEGGYSYLNVDNQVFPFKGVGVSLGVGYLRNIDDNKSFGKALLSTTAFLPLSKQFSLAIRAGGGALSGTADYYNLNSIGGGGSGEMRGYDRERFYGKQSFYLNNDLRWVFNTRNWLYNGKAGLLVFYDMGRVWMPGETSNSLHGSYGGGLIFIPYNRFSLTVTYGVSSETTHINFKTGFYF